MIDRDIEILVAEDSRTQAMKLEFVLEKHNYQVSLATNGAEALDHIHKHKPTMVVSDIIMPGMDGYELCRQIKSDENLKDIPVMLLTSLSDPTDIIEGLECGADSFITKPYTERLLVSRIQHILERRELYEGKKEQMDMVIHLAGAEYCVTANHQRILDFLMATYEDAVEKNHKLKEEIAERKQAEKEIIRLNAELEERVAERTKALAKSNAQNELLLASMSSFLIGVDADDRITHWNPMARETFGIEADDAMGKAFSECNIQWSWTDILKCIVDCREKNQSISLNDIRYERCYGKDGFLNITISPFMGKDPVESGFLILGRDVTGHKILEGRLEQAQKLQAIGQLATGIAHEINTPIHCIMDNLFFLRDSFTKVSASLERCQNRPGTTGSDCILVEPGTDTRNILSKADSESLLEEVPQVFQELLEDVERVTEITHSMNEFSHPGGKEKSPTDINAAIRSTVTVARNEWKYVAEVETDLAPELPMVSCLPGEINQVILNILTNAAHAIADVTGDNATSKGTITISTRHDGDWVEIRISDTGTGIRNEFKPRVFDLFFTTKEPGRGTGQGLAIAHDIVVEKHGGTITFNTELGKGTTFIIRLPIKGDME